MVKKTDYITKVTEIETKLNNHNHDKYITTPEFKKTDYNTKIAENKLNNHKYITTPEFNKLAADVFNARLSRANFLPKRNFDNTVSSLNNKIAENKTKNTS